MEPQGREFRWAGSRREAGAGAGAGVPGGSRGPHPALCPGPRLICKQRPDLCERWQMLKITPLGPLGISLKYTIIFQES